MHRIIYTSFHSPLGPIFIALNGQNVCDLAIIPEKEKFLERLEQKYGLHVEKDIKSLKDVVSRLKDYFSGKKVGFNDIDLAPEGTAFEMEVWKTLLKIPYGETRSYKWVAEKIGRPKSFRAVGGACGRNPIPIVIPCHRVIKETGELGGYSGGLWIKRKLLEIEGVLLPLL